MLGLKNRLKTNSFESGQFIRHSIALNTCFTIKAQNKWVISLTNHLHCLFRFYTLFFMNGKWWCKHHDISWFILAKQILLQDACFFFFTKIKPVVHNRLCWYLCVKSLTPFVVFSKCEKKWVMEIVKEKWQAICFEILLIANNWWV